SLINVIGLTIGITGSLLIYLHIMNELSFDDFHSDNVYRVTRSSDTSSGLDFEANVPYPIIKALNSDFPQIEQATLYHQDRDPVLNIDGEKFKLNNAIFADSNFFDVFDFKIISGNAKRALGQPNNLLLSKKTAELYYGESDPIGKKVKYNQLDLEIVGVFDDLPRNSSIQFDAMVSYPTFSSDYIGGLNIEEWNMSAEGFAFVELNENATQSAAEEQFLVSMKKYYSEESYNRRHFYLQPVKDIHFDAKWNDSAVNTTSLIALGVIGAFLIFIGCVNFINLSTALAVKKSKEIGIRKTLGASKKQLIAQFLGETFIITFVSAILSIGITERVIPIFNNSFNKNLVFNIFQDVNILVFVLLLVIVVTLIAGIYPALILSGYNPIKALKTNIHSQSTGSLFLRKGLIIFQFLISQILIICTIVISSQMDFFTNKSLGFEKEAILNIEMPDSDTDKLDRFREQLMVGTGIENASFSLGEPMSTNTFETNYRLTEDQSELHNRVIIKVGDRFYKDTYGLTLLYGRWFTEADEKAAEQLFETSEEEGQLTYIVNEEGARTLGFANPEDIVGKYITTGIGDISAEVIGVVKDFHLTSLHEKISPAVLVHFPQFYYNTGVKISLENSREAIAHIEESFNNIYPESIFEYSFIDDSIQEFYTNESQTFNLLKLFSGLSIFISCLGLLGMISFIVSQRTKEVGVRKVLGAGVMSIVLLFTKDFMALVIVAFVIASPIAWYVMDSWLGNFAYQINMQVWFFALAMLISVIITFVTIGFQSFQSAISNPVDSLRDE
ncbi:ABC transporter permease, partial [Fulvivirga lutimaris]|uniref:ABC transporter permease n=1 Tax=Fulvivirga lutimaris TaxID=1819566 RepID=UPI0012BC2C8F